MEAENISIKIKDKIQKVGFWIILFILIGFGAGFYSAKVCFKDQVSDIIKTKRLIYDNKIYDISENIMLTSEVNSKTTETKVSAQVEVSKK